MQLAPAQPVNPLPLDSLDDLRHFVHTTLCEQEQLELDAFAMTQRILMRAGRPCGIFFCLHGPRSVKITAIWETDHNSILFYDSAGERRCKVLLTQAPRLEHPDKSSASEAEKSPAKRARRSSRARAAQSA